MECQELNTLHSQSIDGAKITIPERLSNPPEEKEPFILDQLADAATGFSERFLEALPVYDVARDLPQDDTVQYLRQLLRGQRHAFTEFEMLNVAARAVASETLNRDIRWRVSLTRGKYNDGVGMVSVWSVCFGACSCSCVLVGEY